jgi:3-oxoacyl-[acyl-carrier-protein] synthase-1
LISAIGNNRHQCLDALLKAQTGIGAINHLQTIHNHEFVVGEVKLSNDEMFEQLGIAKNRQDGFTRTALLGAMAVREAIQDAGLNDALLADTALVSGTTVGGMDKTELEWHNRLADARFLMAHPCGESTQQMAECNGLNGYMTTLSTACSSGANAIIHGVRLIRSGRAKRVIAGGVDALSRFTLNGFNSLMIVDPELCRPFDSSRRGLNLGEGAGFVVLESEEEVKQRGGHCYCELKGFANANDAYHQTASSPDGEGAFLAMSKALQVAGLNPGDIDYINAHGTGTENNDHSESVAIHRVFGSQVPRYSSTKAYTGHTLGASAGIEAVISVMAIEQQVIFPNLRFQNGIEGIESLPHTGECFQTVINHVASNSFGFGGNNSTLIFSKV